MKLPLRVLSILSIVAWAGAVEPAASPALEKGKSDQVTGNVSPGTATPQPAQQGVDKSLDRPPGVKRTPQIMTAELKAAAELVRAGQIMDAEHLAAGLKLPTHEKVALCAPLQTRLSGREIAEHARAGYVRVGWYYHCSECGNWHVNTSGGYAIAADTVATAYHVLESPAKMRNAEGYPIAVRNESEVFPVLAVLAADKDMDAVVLRIGASNLAPLALSDDERVGDTVFCLSDPHGVRGYFSSGMINRFFSTRPGAGSDARFQRINVSTDWAPGSSGAAVLDERGNVAGHVARIFSIFNDQQAPDANDHAGAGPATLMNLHEAVPAKSVRALIAN